MYTLGFLHKKPKGCIVSADWFFNQSPLYDTAPSPWVHFYAYSVQQKVRVHHALPKAATAQQQVHFKGLVTDVILTCTSLVCNYRKQSEI